MCKSESVSKGKYELILQKRRSWGVDDEEGKSKKRQKGKEKVGMGNLPW